MIRQIPLPLPHDSAMGADDFMITASNRDAAAWVTRWPDWPAHGLIVTGPSGSGKTHLLHLWLAQSGGQMVTKSDLLSRDPVTIALKNPRIALDDCDGYAGDAAAEEALFHLYNYQKATKGSLLIALTRGAGQSNFALPDLRSRLLTLPAAALTDPDDELLSALYVKQFRDRQITLDAATASYLATHGARDAAGIRDLIDRIDRAALAGNRKITVSLAKLVLEERDE